MTKCYIKAVVVDYEQGEYWASIDNGKTAFPVEENKIIPEKHLVNRENFVDPEELTGTLGQLMDEIDLPSDLLKQVQDIYNHAATYLLPKLRT